MLNVDLASLVRDALIENGCGDSVLGDFDTHSTISIDFENLPSMLISQEEDDVWIWCQLGNHHPNIISQRASEFMDIILTTSPYFRTGQPQLSINDGMIELKALLHTDCFMKVTNFSEVLQQFFELIERSSEII